MWGLVIGVFNFRQRGNSRHTATVAAATHFIYLSKPLFSFFSHLFCQYKVYTNTEMILLPAVWIIFWLFTNNHESAPILSTCCRWFARCLWTTLRQNPFCVSALFVCAVINTSSVHVLCGGTEHQNVSKTDYNIHVEINPRIFCLLYALTNAHSHAFLWQTFTTAASYDATSVAASFMSHTNSVCSSENGNSSKIFLLDLKMVNMNMVAVPINTRMTRHKIRQK